MDFSFTSEQTQLGDAIQRYVANEYGFEARKKIVYSETGMSQAVWQQLADLGVFALPVDEQYGGFGGSAVDLLVVMRELGRGLVVEPVFSTLLGAEFLKRAGNEEQRGRLAHVADGSLKLACALHERQSRHELFNVETTVRASGEGYLLDGTKTVVVHGGQAEGLIVSARLSGGARERSGLGLFWVDAGAAGVTRKEYRTIDGLRAADIRFDAVPLGRDALLGAGGEAWSVIDAVSDYGVALLCAEAIGVMETLNAHTLEYTKTRKQFGQPIARFQVLQHRMVEMFMHLEQARSMAYLAAVKASSGDAAERRRCVSAAKVRVGQAGRYIGQQAVQLHGGMGVTNELPAAHYFKRLTMIETTLGDTDHHLARFVEQGSAAEARAELRHAA
ncbi:MAG: acyl-CoA dehydrogenase family protein [Burkholderiaceae bacterium]